MMPVSSGWGVESPLEESIVENLSEVMGACDVTAGDVNQDQQVNVLDVVSLVHHIIGTAVLPMDALCGGCYQALTGTAAFSEQVAACNVLPELTPDGTLNVLDVVALTQFILDPEGYPMDPSALSPCAPCQVELMALGGGAGECFWKAPDGSSFSKYATEQEIAQLGLSCSGTCDPGETCTQHAANEWGYLLCDCSGGCGAGEVVDSSDGSCHPATWVGDGLCDGPTRQWHADLTAYECDGGDCVDCLGVCGGDAGLEACTGVSLSSYAECYMDCYPEDVECTLACAGLMEPSTASIHLFAQISSIECDAGTQGPCAGFGDLCLMAYSAADIEEEIRTKLPPWVQGKGGLDDAFDWADQNGDGKLNASEIQRVLGPDGCDIDEGWTPWFLITRAILKRFDLDKDKHLSKDELEKVIQDLSAESECEEDDCAEDSCTENICIDCAGQDCTGHEGWVGDGYCDDGASGFDFNCMAFEGDGGDCAAGPGGETSLCGADFVSDCSGDGDCCPVSYIGDGYGDCAEQAYGCDLSCYDNDGGDCGSSGEWPPGDVGDCIDCQGQDCSGYESWIGDGWCDDGAYGMYFNCAAFNDDGGDCEVSIPGSEDEGEEPVDCPECEVQDCPEYAVWASDDPYWIPAFDCDGGALNCDGDTSPVTGTLIVTWPGFVPLEGTCTGDYPDGGHKLSDNVTNVAGLKPGEKVKVKVTISWIDGEGNTQVRVDDHHQYGPCGSGGTKDL